MELCSWDALVTDGDALTWRSDDSPCRGRLVGRALSSMAVEYETIDQMVKLLLR